MKRVLSGSTLPDTTHFQNVLEQAGIASTIKNRHLGGGIGDLPVFDAAPELWVLDDRQVDRATALIRDCQGPTTAGAPWRCGKCGESNEAQFAACWCCGSNDSRPQEPA